MLHLVVNARLQQRELLLWAVKLAWSSVLDCNGLDCRIWLRLSTPGRRRIPSSGPPSSSSSSSSSIKETTIPQIWQNWNSNHLQILLFACSCSLLDFLFYKCPQSPHPKESLAVSSQYMSSVSFPLCFFSATELRMLPHPTGR